MGQVKSVDGYEQGYAEVNGTRLYFELAGAGHPLVLVHGFALDTGMWDDQFAAFAGRYRVLRYDLRGFGKSALPGAESYYHHEDLRALLNHLGLDRAHVVALSLGGAIALEFALAYPQRTATLIPVDSVLWGFDWGHDEYGVSHVWRAGRQSGAAAARELWLAHPYFVHALANPAVAPRLRQITEDYSGWGWTSHDPGLIPDPPAAQRLSQIAAPTLVIVGERDVPDFHRISATLAREIPGARKIVIAGAGHMSNMEAPEEFNRAVLGFLAEVESGTGASIFLDRAMSLNLEGPPDWAEKIEDYLYDREKDSEH